MATVIDMDKLNRALDLQRQAREADAAGQPAKADRLRKEADALFEEIDAELEPEKESVK